MIDKYLDLVRELKKKKEKKTLVTVIPFVIGTLGMVLKSLEKDWQNWNSEEESRLENCWIKLECSEESRRPELDLNSSETTSHSTSVKKLITMAICFHRIISFPIFQVVKRFQLNNNNNNNVI